MNFCVKGISLVPWQQQYVKAISGNTFSPRLFPATPRIETLQGLNANKIKTTLNFIFYCPNCALKLSFGKYADAYDFALEKKRVLNISNNILPVICSEISLKIYDTYFCSNAIWAHKKAKILNFEILCNKNFYKIKHIANLK